MRTTPAQHVAVWTSLNAEAEQWRKVAEDFRLSQVGTAKQRRIAADLADAMADRVAAEARDVLLNATNAQA